MKTAAQPKRDPSIVKRTDGASSGGGGPGDRGRAGSRLRTRTPIAQRIATPAPLSPRGVKDRAEAAFRRFPLVRKLSLLVAAVVVAISLFSGVSTYRREIRLLRDEMGERLLAVVSTGALTIDGDHHRKARGPGIAEYDEVRAQVRAIRDANKLGYDHVYTLRRVDGGGFVFAVTPHDDDKAFPGTPYAPAAPPSTLAAMARVMETGNAEATSLWQDESGAWISAFAPIRAKKGEHAGEVVGLLEADVAAHELDAAAFSAARGVLFDGALAAAIAALLGAVFARRLTQPLRLLTDRMELIASGKADLTDEIDAGQVRDFELRGLVEGFNRSVKSLRDLVSTVHRIGNRAAGNASEGEEVARSLLDGCRGQTRALEQTRVAAQALDTATSSIAQATEQLDSSAHEIAAAVVGIEQSVSGASGSLSRMNESIITTATNIGQLTGAIQTINQNVTTLSETAEGVTGSVSDLDKSLREINRFTEETAVFSVTTREAAEAGREAVSVTAEGMTEIEAHTRRVSETMISLARTSEEIGDIVQVIRSVAERTNLLALNAAIIAARAGEQGQGFQVVAQEIRDLAERTRMSTSDIAALIARVQRESAEAVQMVTLQADSVAKGRELAVEALGELDRIRSVADETSSRIERIVQRAEEQTRASKKVLSGVESIQVLLQVITRATREQSQASGAVQRAADQMQEDSQHTTAAFTDQAAQIRGIVQTMERMAERIGAIHLQTRGQTGDAQRLGQGMAEVLSLAEGFSDQAHKLDGAMAAIAADVAVLSAEVNRFKIA